MEYDTQIEQTPANMTFTPGAFVTTCSPCRTLCSPQAGGKGSTSIAVQEVDGEAFEGVSVRHRPPHRVLELLVAAGDAGAALQLIGRQCRGQQVGQVVVPHSRQIQVLEESNTEPILCSVILRLHIKTERLTCDWSKANKGSVQQNHTQKKKHATLPLPPEQCHIHTV